MKLGKNERAILLALAGRAMPLCSSELAQSSVQFLPGLYFNNLYSKPANRLVEKGLVEKRQERNRALWGLTPKGEMVIFQITGGLPVENFERGKKMTSKEEMIRFFRYNTNPVVQSILFQWNYYNRITEKQLSFLQREKDRIEKKCKEIKQREVKKNGR